MANFTRPYFLLVEQGSDGKWSAQFGDHDAETVKTERGDLRDGDRHKAKADRHGPLKVIRADNASRKACEAAVAKLNDEVGR